MPIPILAGALVSNVLFIGSGAARGIARIQDASFYFRA